MKDGIHPEWYPDAKVIVNGEVVMTVGSTRPELSVEVWSGTHPFYTGQQRLVDTEGQVERFLKRLQRRQEIQVEEEEAEEAQSATTLAIDDIGLNSRALKALQSAGHTTVGDLLAVFESSGDDGLLAISGVGQKALIDIKRFMRTEELID